MRHPALFPTLVFAATLAMTVPMLPSDVSFEDSAEFTAAAAVFGMPHPSGYPLYVLLAHGFARLPIGTVPWRVALFSAVCASVAATLLFIAARRLADDRRRGLPLVSEAAMAVVFLQLAATLTWLGQAITAEVYALHAALFAAVVLSVIHWSERGSRASLAAACFLYGLSLADHLFLSLAAAPLFALALALGRPSAAKDVRMLATAFIAFVCGLLPYAAVPSMSRGAYVFQPVIDAAGLLGLLFRTSYADVGGTGWNKFGLVVSYGRQLATELGPLVLAAAGYGAWRFTRNGSRAAKAALAWSAGALIAVPIAATLQSIDMSEQAEYVYRVFAVGGMSALALFAACAVARLAVSVPLRTAAFALAVAAVIPVTSFAGSVRIAAAFADPYPAALVRAMLEPLPADAVLIAADEGIVRDSVLFGLAYLQSAERLRPDVAVINDNVTSPLVVPGLPSGYWELDLAGRRRALVDAVRTDPSYDGRPIFATFAAEASVPGFISTSNGVVYRLRRLEEARVPEPAVALPPLPLALAGRHYALGAVASHALYAQAARRFDEAGTRAALGSLLDAIRLDPRPFSSDYLGFVYHRDAVASFQEEVIK